MDNVEYDIDYVALDKEQEEIAKEAKVLTDKVYHNLIHNINLEQAKAIATVLSMGSEEDKSTLIDHILKHYDF
jgi:hypothetical protein